MTVTLERRDAGAEPRAGATAELPLDPSHYEQLPRMLVLNLMHRCNLRCSFCMVARQIEQYQLPSLEALLALVSRQSRDTRIVFFGGEPTIHPHFIHLLRRAREIGLPCSISTNALAFASRRFTAHIAALGAAEIGIQTSLYGPEAEIHDALTGVRGSFTKTSRGIANLLNAGFPGLLVNVLIMASNARHLSRCISHLTALGVPNIKFSTPVGAEQCPQHLCRLDLVRPFLERAVEQALASGHNVVIEKTPLCALPLHLSRFVNDRITSPAPRVFDPRCSTCIGRSKCYGLDPGYATAFVETGVQPFAAVDRRNVIHTPSPATLDMLELQPDLLHLIAWDLGRETNVDVLLSLARLRQRALDQCADILFLSDHDLEPPQ